MTGERELNKLLKSMNPVLNPGDFVFCTVKDLSALKLNEMVSIFREKEGISIIIRKELADSLNLDYSYIASWITLTVHSSLEAVGLTAAFSKALSSAGISSNVVAACFHDHIFVGKNDAEKAMNILSGLSK